jgi:hypothetical protein
MSPWVIRGLAAVALTLPQLGGSALAADPEFCEHYARAAVNQSRIAHEYGSCASRAGGNRWSGDYRKHFNWCVGAPYEAAESERTFRQRFLDHCTHGG